MISARYMYSVILSVLDPRKCEYLKDYSLDFEHAYMTTIQVSQEEGTKLRESVPYVKIYRYNPEHLYPKLNGYRDNGQRKVWFSGGSMHCTLSADGLSRVCPRLPCQITEIPLTLFRQYSTMAECMSCIVLGTLKDNYDVSAGFFVVQFNGFMSLTS